MFNFFDWNAFMQVWQEWLKFMDTVVAWLMYVLADGPKPPATYP